MQTEIPEGWTREPLKNLGRLYKSRGGSKADEQETGVPVVRYGELYTRHDDVIRGFHSFVSEERASDYTKLQIGDVLFAGSGETLDEIGKSAVFLGPEPAHGSGDIIGLRPNDRVDPLFLGYATNGPEAVEQKARMGQGSSVMHIYSHNLEKLALNVPPLPEQKKIAAILSSVDEAIQATEAVIEQTRRVKEGLLQDLLTRGIGHTRFKQTEIGEIPESWETRPVTEVGEVTMGRQKAPKYMTGDFTRPYLRVVNVFDDRLDLDDVAEMDFDSADFERYRLQHGDVLVTEGDLVSAWNVGRTAVYRGEIDECCFQNTLIRLRPNIVEDGDFYHLAISSLRVRGCLARLAAGTTVFHLGSTRFEKVVVPVPPPHERAKLVEAFASVDSTLDTATSKVQRLKQVKAGLLQDLLTGAVRVSA